MSTSDNNFLGREPIPPALGSRSSAAKATWAAYAAFLFVYACVATNLPIIAIPEAAVDDGLYVRGAINILKGDWLGPYDNLTLSKGPFYSLWIAVNSFTGLPLLLSQGVLYGVSCLTLARAVRPWLRSELATFCFFVFLLLSPVPVSEGELRVMREGIYSPMTILVVASCIWWIRLRRERIRKRAVFSIGFGLLLGSYWLTREESVLISVTLAAALLALLYLAFHLADRIGSMSREIGLSALTFLAAAVLYGGFGSLNSRFYGVSDIVEFKQSEFISAYGALARIRHSDPRRYVVVPREALERAFAVSSSAAELQTYFKQPGFVEAGCAAFGINPCDSEVRGAWFMWALRDAVASRGHYATAVEARRFYAAIAKELNDACDAGRIACAARRDTMIPRFSVADVLKTGQRAGEILWFVATLEAIEPGNWGKPHSCYFDDCGASPLYRNFLDIANTTLYTHATWLPLTTTGERNVNDGNTLVQKRSVSVSSGLNVIAAAYRMLLPMLCIIAAVCYVVVLAMAGITRSLEGTTLLSTIALITLLTRVLFLAFLDAVAGMPSVNTLYLSPVFPLLLMFVFLSLSSVFFQFKKFERDFRTVRMLRMQQTTP